MLPTDIHTLIVSFIPTPVSLLSGFIDEIVSTPHSGRTSHLTIFHARYELTRFYWLRFYPDTVKSIDAIRIRNFESNRHIVITPDNHEPLDDFMREDHPLLMRSQIRNKG